MKGSLIPAPLALACQPLRHVDRSKDCVTLPLRSKETRLVPLLCAALVKPAGSKLAGKPSAQAAERRNIGRSSQSCWQCYSSGQRAAQAWHDAFASGARPRCLTWEEPPPRLTRRPQPQRQPLATAGSSQPPRGRRQARRRRPSRRSCVAGWKAQWKSKWWTPAGAAGACSRSLPSRETSGGSLQQQIYQLLGSWMLHPKF